MTYVQLIEPDGTPNMRVRLETAISYCAVHPGWTWRYVDEDCP